jgi:hypothetical protein
MKKKRIEYQVKAVEKIRDYLEELRDLRNQKLADFDWTQGNDSPIIEVKKQEWKVYRQILRDLPNNTIDPKKPVWPLPPTP